jgi:hypothetical protein
MVCADSGRGPRICRRLTQPISLQPEQHGVLLRPALPRIRKGWCHGRLAHV